MLAIRAAARVRGDCPAGGTAGRGAGVDRRAGRPPAGIGRAVRRGAAPADRRTRARRGAVAAGRRSACLVRGARRACVRARRRSGPARGGGAGSRGSPVGARDGEKEQKTTERAALDVATSEALTRLDAAVAALDGLRQDVRVAEDAVTALRSRVDARGLARQAGTPRRSTTSGADATELEVARATAESDLSHLAAHLRRDRAGAARGSAGGSGAARARRCCRARFVDASRLRRRRRARTRRRRGRASIRQRSSRVAQAGPVSTEEAIHSLKCQDRSPGPGEHDGHRAVRRARDAPPCS